MRRGGAFAGLIFMLAPAFAQPADDARQALAMSRAAGDRARADALRLQETAAAADKRVVRVRQAVAAIDRSIAQSDAALAAARTRLAAARAASAASEAVLARARAPLATLVATLVRRERQPSALLLMTPPRLAENAHLRAAMAGVAPVIEARSAALREAVADAAARRRAADDAVIEVVAFRRTRDRQRAALQSAVFEETRQRDRALADAEGSRQQADGLAEQASSLEALVERLGRRGGAGARLAALPGPVLRPGTVAGPAGMPAYRLPARGRLLAGTGEASANGVHMRGILLATETDAVVRAPAGGVIAYAGAFRAWKAIVIVDHGHGWTTLVAGLSAVARSSGTTVAQGEPIGRAGTRLLVELRHRGRPIDVAAMAAASS